MELTRVMVIGCGGSGKSTFARALARRTGLPLIHLDQEFWSPGWVERYDDAGWARRVSELASGDRWVIDGNYSKTIDLRLPRATTILWLDLPRWVCLGSALRRSLVHYGQVRTDSAPGCHERLDGEFLAYIWNWFNTSRPGVIRRLALPDYASRARRFATRQAAWQWLEALPSMDGASLPELNNVPVE
jgi:adenylate kinase family enzyme